MAYLLHLETATEVCSVAISDNHRLISEITIDKHFQHTAELAPLIQQVLSNAALKPNDLNAVSLSKGPGSYTALRAGLSTAKGLCYALNIPLIAIDTLQSVAMATVQPADSENTLYVPMIDARRMEVYAGVFDKSGNSIEEISAVILTPESYLDPQFENRTRIVFSGNGSGKFAPICQNPTAEFRDTTCNATHLVPVAMKSFQQNEFVDIAYFSPLYLKAPNITTPKKGIPLMKNK